MKEVERSKRRATLDEEEGSTSKTLRKAYKRVVSEAKKRNCILLTMPEGMSKHSRNSSRYDSKTSTIFWRVECFVNNELKHHVKSASENEIVKTIISSHSDLKDKPLIVKLEVKDQEPVVVDANQPLGEILTGKTIVEFPTFHLDVMNEEPR